MLNLYFCKKKQVGVLLKYRSGFTYPKKLRNFCFCFILKKNDLKFCPEFHVFFSNVLEHTEFRAKLQIFFSFFHSGELVSVLHKMLLEIRSEKLHLCHQFWKNFQNHWIMIQFFEV